MPLSLREDLQEEIAGHGTWAMICRLCLSDEVGGVGRATPRQDLAQEVAMRFVAEGRGHHLNGACGHGRVSERGRP
jgi:hypothetical protein